MNKVKKLLISTMLASVTMTSISGVQILAQNNSYDIEVAEQSVMPRYRYIISSKLIFDVTGSKATYKLNVKGIDEVTKISGTLTLYKDGEYVTSKRISENSNMLNTSGTLTASGRGSYELIFSGTVSTKNGSEPITISETDSYWAEIIELQ